LAQILSEPVQKYNFFSFMAAKLGKTEKKYSGSEIRDSVVKKSGSWIRDTLIGDWRLDSKAIPESSDTVELSESGRWKSDD
jgi:hypothetical protein